MPEDTSRNINDFTGQWAILPAKIRYDKALPANAKLIYAEIAAKINEVGYCFCHNRHFAERFGLKPDTVSSLIKRLERAGYIKIDIGCERANAERRRIYLTAKPYEFEGIGFKSSTLEKSEGVSDLNPVPIENKELKLNPPIVPQEGDGEEKQKKPRRKREPKKEPDWKPERFAAFWEAYPRGESKQAAIAAWDKLKPSDELLIIMAKALKRQMQTEAWQNNIGIPYASTWLNNARWTDVVTQPGTAKKQRKEAERLQVWS